MAVPDEFSADKIRAALMLTRRAADAQFWLAYDLVSRLPAIHAAMAAGVLDEPHARVFSDWTTQLYPEQARALCDELLPRAATLTTGQLIEQIKSWPSPSIRTGRSVATNRLWPSARWSATAIRTGRRTYPGTACLSAKRAGDGRPIDHIRAELFLGMTDGSYAGLDDAAILEHLRHADGDKDKPDCDSSRPDEAEGGDTEGGDLQSGAVGGRTQRGPIGAGMELYVRLSTLLGRDDYPAELAGWGPVHAVLAGSPPPRWAVRNGALRSRRPRPSQAVRDHSRPAHRRTRPHGDLPRDRGT